MTQVALAYLKCSARVYDYGPSVNVSDNAGLTILHGKMERLDAEISGKHTYTSTFAVVYFQALFGLTDASCLGVID